MFSNRHVVVAMLVAPVLAIVAWFAVDYLVAERPHAAREGATYKLVAKPNCRYASGQCDLENGDFRLTLRPGMLAASSIALTLTSSHALESAVLALVASESGQPPSPMTRTADDGREWQGLLPHSASADAHIRVAVTAQGATWYAEVPIVFLESPD